MNSSEIQIFDVIGLRPFSIPGRTLAASMAAATAACLWANAQLGLEVKTAGFLAIVLLLAATSVALYVREYRVRITLSRKTDLEQSLSDLREAGKYLGGRIGTDDALRLILHRTQQILPAVSAILWKMDADRKTPVPLNNDSTEHRLVVACLASASVNTGSALGNDGSTSEAAAIPLLREGSVYGVLQLTFTGDHQLTEFNKEILEDVGHSVSPLILSALAFDRSRDNALTDATTDLPNERALYLILQDRIAEASRTAISSQLMVIAMDVKGFDGINRRFGHAAGDAVLGQAAGRIKDSLRQMDFLARVSSDEFVAVLPGASVEVSADVIARIEKSFSERQFDLSASESIQIEFNFGGAQLGRDGHTAQDMVTAAMRRKSRVKYPALSNILTFPSHFSA